MQDESNLTSEPAAPAVRPDRLFQAMLTIGAVTAVARLASVAREFYVAASFGVGDLVDAFLIAYMLPSFAVAIIAGAFQSSIVPVWIHEREASGDSASNALAENACGWAIVLLVTTTAVLAALFPLALPLIASGFPPEKLALTTRLFYALLPVVALGGLSGFWIAILNAGERFAAPAFLPTITPLAVIAALAASPEPGIGVLAAATVAGAAVELVATSILMRRHALPIRPRLRRPDSATMRAVKQFLPMVGGALIMSSTTVVDQSMAAMLGAGSVSALGYGNKLISFAIGIASMAIGTALLPHFSKKVATNDWEGLRTTTRRWTMLIAAVSVPLTIVAVVWSESIVRLFFERGEFTAADTILVGSVQRAFLWQIPFYLLGTIGVRLLSAAGRNHVIAMIATFNFFLNIVLNYWLSRRFGVTGIALSTSLVYAVSTSLVFIAVAASRPRPPDDQSLRAT